MIEIYTDGAYNPVLGQGGWGAVVLEDEQKRVFSGRAKKTTSNRMEITAALEGILRTPQGAEVVVYTDSQYLFGCMAKGWQRRANLDLWERLDEAVSQRKVRWEWIDRNAKSPFHKEAHALATNLASQGERLEPVPSEKGKGGPKAAVVQELTHIDALGRPRMVDVSDKPDTQREAVAKGVVRMQASTLDRLRKGKVAKGDVLAVAQLAGIMAAKETPHLIPLCHPILIADIKVEFSLDEENSAVEITTTVKSTGKTGVEMEALMATAVTALTIYDMCKAVDRSMRIENIRLVRKSGGKSETVNLE
ncbi:MAG: cyclic pyranopterin monophosphate synthase MoaC [Dehalococcoidales bacterium]|nr:cyclic pyranopterin monophosphate synthase MoaC [Dehalococcoidales bacterium]